MTTLHKWNFLKDNIKVKKALDIQNFIGNRQPEIQRLVERIVHLAKNPLTLVIMGEFSAGKSSFLNRLLGFDVLPVSILPRTATVTRLLWGEKEQVEIDYLLGDSVVTKTATREEFSQLQLAAKVNDPLVLQEMERIQEVRIFLDIPLLKKLQLLDTPGFNHDQAMDKKTMAVLESADALIWIADYTQVGKQSEFERLEQLKSHGKRIWLVVNKGDVHINERTEHQQALEQLQQHLETSRFLDFFEAREILLVSSKSKEPLWDALFLSLTARLGERILNADMELSLELINDAWEQLGKRLADETERTQALSAASQHIRKLLMAESVANQYLSLLENLIPQLDGLREALVARRKRRESLYNSDIESLNSFAMACTRNGMDKRIRDLRNAYASILSKFHQQYLMLLIGDIERIMGLMPATQQRLEQDFGNLATHSRFLSQAAEFNAPQSPVFSLPTVEHVSELLDHIGIQFGDLYCRFTTQVEETGVLSVAESAPKLSLSAYIELELEAALLRDFRHDVERFLHNLNLKYLVDQFHEFCGDSDHSLSQALGLWETIK